MNINSTHNTQMFASFLLDDVEYAIDIAHIREVVSYPSSLIHIPSAQSYIQGLFKLRENILTVVDLRQLFTSGKKESSIDNSEKRIVVINYNGSQIGVCFDATSQTFRFDHSRYVEVHGDDNCFVEGAYKLNDVNEIVQVLNLEKIFSLANLPKTSPDSGEETQLRRKTNQIRSKKCIAFHVGDVLCGFNLEVIQEIVKPDEILSNSQNISYLNSSILVRNRKVSVVDFAKAIGSQKKTNSPLEERRIIIVLFGDDLVGLMVDSIESIFSYSQEDLLEYPHLGGKNSEMFLGCLQTKEKNDVYLFHHESIVKRYEEIAGARSLFKTVNVAVKKNEETKNKMERESYLSICVDSSYAVKISEISEIIDYPVLDTCNLCLPELYDGVLNLRGQLIGLLNVRKLYDLPQIHSQSEQKVLIFQFEKRKYGLIVDSIHSILHVSKDKVLPAPKLKFPIDDISKVICLTNADEQAESLFVLDLQKIIERMGFDKHENKELSAA